MFPVDLVLPLSSGLILIKKCAQTPIICIFKGKTNSSHNVFSMSPYLAEFFGTMLLIVLGEGVVAGIVLKGTKSENAGWLTICVAWGLAVTLAVYAVGSVSGAHLNPALTIALTLFSDFPSDQMAGYILAQFAGAFVGAGKIHLILRQNWRCFQQPQQFATGS
jgi:glycerol uptake facilitator-like aquaporin